MYKKVKVKQSRYMPGEAQKVLRKLKNYVYFIDKTMGGEGGGNIRGSKLCVNPKQ